MKLIHFTADDGWEAVVFTNEDPVDPNDYVYSVDRARPGFSVNFCGAIEEPQGFFPPENTLLVKQP